MINLKWNKVFITATNTDIGKSYVAEELLKLYSLFGFRVGYFKPIETGVITEPKDGTKLLNVVKKLNKDFILSVDEVVPYQFELPASPFVAKENIKIDLNLIKDKLAQIEELSDIVIIEGAGGLLVPIENDFFMIDLIKELQAKALLVVPSGLGSINDTLLSIGKLEEKKIPFEWVVNLYKDSKNFNLITKPFYQKYFTNFFDFQKNSIQVANRLIY